MKLFHRLLFLTLSIMLVLTACGGDASTDSDSPAKPTAEAPAENDQDKASGDSAESTDATQEEDSKDITPIAVNVGYIPDYAGASLMAIANDKNLWEKHGLDVNLSTFTNGPLQIQALGTKDLDFGYIGVGAMWLPASGQAKVAAINVLGLSDRVIAQPGITSVADLKGKKVGIPEGTSGDMILSLALEEAGLTEEDIERIPMDPGTLVASFASGQIDGAGIWYPHVQTLEDQVEGMEIIAESKDFSKKLQFPSATVMREGLDSENPELVKRMVQLLREATDIRANELDYSIEITAKLIELDPADIKKEAAFAEYLTSAELDELTKDGTVYTWLDNLGRFYQKMGKINEGDLLPGKDFYLGDVFMGTAK